MYSLKTSAAIILFSMCLAVQNGASAKIVLNHYQYEWHGPSVIELVKKHALLYEKANPNVKINLTVVPGLAYLEKIMITTAAGKGPDIVEVYPGMAGSFVANRMFTDLRPYMAGDSRFKDDKYSKVSIDSFTYNSGIWGLPVTGGAISTLYNKTMYDQAGLMDPNIQSAAGRWIWETMVEDAKKLTKRNSNGKISQYGIFMNQDMNRWAMFVYQAGGGIFDRITQPTRGSFTSVEAKKGVSFYTDFFTKFNVAGGNFVNNADVALYPFAGAWDVGNMAKAYKGKVNYDVVIPAKGPKSSATLSFVNGFEILNGSRYKREAWKWLSYLGSPELQTEWIKATGRTPVFKSMGKEYEDLAPLPPKHIGIFMDLADNKDTYSPYDSSLKNFKNFAQDQITAIISKKKSVDQALDEAEKWYNSNLARIKKK